MTFEELDRRFPNGFDDAELNGLIIDYEKRTATFRLNLRSNSPDSPQRNVYSSAVLRAHEIYYLSIDPPDSDHVFSQRSSKITVDGHPEDPQDFPLFGQLKARLPSSA